MVQQHAAMLAFVEAFWLMGVVFLLMLPFLPLLEYSKPSRKPKAVCESREGMVAIEAAEAWPDDPEQESQEHEEDRRLVLH
ncbi:MAG: hypothetical protein ABSG34_13860 [Candidatus Sulfotelmatobacter sp.]